jgi:ABC-type xylose transport system permease subunit
VLTGVQIHWQMVVRGLILIVAVTLDSFRKGGGYR